jgi:xanthine/CO dehydrogenase XdhC/CoxF family maturation factor
MPAPTGPILPMSELSLRTHDVRPADVVAAVRDSGTVISFLAGGAALDSLTTRVYDVITSQEGCGLGRSSDMNTFAEQFCATSAGRRRLAVALAAHRPTTDPTALLTRAAVTAWVRTVGLATQTGAARETEGTGLPDWHLPGDM